MFRSRDGVSRNTAIPIGRRSLPNDHNRGATAVKSSSVVLFPQPALQLIYDTAPIGLAFLSPDCRYLQINQRLTEICGISVEDHLGRSVRDCVPALAEAVEGIVGSIMETGEPVTGIEVAGQRADQTEERFWVTYWHPMRGPSGEIRRRQRRRGRDYRAQARRSRAAGQRARDTQRQGCGRGRAAKSAGNPELADRSGKTRRPRTAGGGCCA